MALVERGGKVRSFHVPEVTATTLKPIIVDAIAKDSHFRTDESGVYVQAGRQFEGHGTVNHSIEEYVRGDVHTNSIEGVWSLFKRSIIGSYHQISTKHMDAYLDEFEWRFNQRSNAYLFRDTMLKLINSPKMEYKELIEKSA